MYQCQYCGRQISRSDNLRRHIKNSCPDVERVLDEPPSKKIKKNDEAVPSTSKTEFCTACNQIIPLNRYTGHLRSLHHKANSCINVCEGIEIINTAFRRRIISYRISSDRHHLDYEEFLNEIKVKVLQLMECEVIKQKSLKVNVEAFGRYIQQTQDLIDVKSFNTSNKVINEGVDLTEIYSDFVDIIKSKALEFEEGESGKESLYEVDKY